MVELKNTLSALTSGAMPERPEGVDDSLHNRAILLASVYNPADRPDSGASRAIALADAADKEQTQPNDPRPWLHAIGRHRAGRSRATLDAISLQTASNYDFVERINEDCRVGPHLEWIVAGTGAALKASAAGFIGARVGAHAGRVGMITGIAGGGIKGLIAGAFAGYESAEFLENSCKAGAYEKRLLQDPKTPPSDDAPGLPIPDALQFDVEPNILSVRDLVDHGQDKIRELYHGKPPQDHNLLMYQTAMDHNDLDNSSFVDWAKKQSYWTLPEKTAHYGAFGALGLGGGWYVSSELHLTNRSALIAKGIGTAAGLLLSWMRIGAKENINLSELYSARLLDRPDDRP